MDASVTLNLLPLVADANSVRRHSLFWLPALFRGLGGCGAFAFLPRER